MSVSNSGDNEPTAKERRLAREVKRLRYELEVSGRQTPMLRAIIEGSPDALALLSLSGEVVEHNRAFGKLADADVPCHGRSVAECLGRPTTASGAPITELLDHEVLSASLEDPQTLVGALGDDLIEARLSGFGEDRGVVLALRVLDTEARQARELSQARARLQALGLQLEKQRQMDEAERLESLSMLAGSLAHDLNNALACILQNAELAREQVELGGQVGEELDGIVEAVLGATSISRQPASAWARIHAILTSVGRIASMLCRPSRGPTSLTRMSISLIEFLSKTMP